MTRYENRARVLAKAAAEACGGTGSWYHSKERPDGTMQVYAPSYGPLRRVVPVVETAASFGRLVAAHSPDVVRALAEVVARLRERVAEGHTGECAWRPGGAATVYAVISYDGDPNHAIRTSDLLCTCGHDEDAAGLARLDAVTGGGG